jgi:SAM-dependent methyltransferase
LKAKLVDYLVCSVCKCQLQCAIQREDNNFSWSEIIDGSLICKKCHHEFQIRNGVPRMVVGKLAKDVRNTIEAFGWEWHKFDDPIQDTYMTGKNNFLDFIDPVKEEFFEDKFVLDAGCGMGRFLKLGAEFGCREIIGVDLSNSVDEAYRHTRELPNAHVVQADILALPFAKQFDYIFSVGVLQFMPDPKDGFASLVKYLKDEGKISVWVYSRENNGWAIYLLSPLRKHITSRLPRPSLYFISCCLGLIQYACLKLIYKPANENRFGIKLGKLLPYNDYLYHNSRLTYLSLVSIIFDHLSPQITAYISRDEVECWFREKNFTEVIITSRNNMSWCGFGTRGWTFKNPAIN